MYVRTYIYIYVCVYIVGPNTRARLSCTRMRTYIRTYIPRLYVHTYIFMYSLYVYTYVCVCVCTSYVCTRKYVGVYICMYTQIPILSHTSLYSHIYICTCHIHIHMYRSWYCHRFIYLYITCTRTRILHVHTPGVQLPSLPEFYMYTCTHTHIHARLRCQRCLSFPTRRQTQAASSSQYTLHIYTHSCSTYFSHSHI